MIGIDSISSLLTALFHYSALTIKAINSGVRVPDGLLAAYPGYIIN